MNTIPQTVVTTALQTAAALAATDPKAAAAVALAPVIVQLLQTGEQMMTAGTLTPEKLQMLYNSVSANVKAVHDEWAAM
jgi:hypothetical protein